MDFREILSTLLMFIGLTWIAVWLYQNRAKLKEISKELEDDESKDKDKAGEQPAQER